MDSGRKLAAILVADVAGYSRLMHGDEDATVTALDECRDIFRESIKAHRGQVVDMTGDSVLAMFETATGAVTAALAIQARLGPRNEALPEGRRMHFRIGVNLGEVISKENGTIYGDGVNIAARLESLAEAGSVTLSGTVYDQVKNRLQVAFTFLGEKWVKNIPEPVRVYRARSAASPPVTAVPAIDAGVVAAPLPLPDKPSIVILPFINISEDPQQEYFSDGMTEDVTTSLSKLSGIFVIARNSAFTYKGRILKPEQIGHELGVRYVLEGSVRRAGRKVRITARLIDAATGYQLWAEHYDGQIKDVFGLQDRITRQIVAALALTLTPREEALRARSETTSVEAYDLVLRSLALARQLQKESSVTARQMLHKAIAIDPRYARAYVILSWIYNNEWSYQWTVEPGTLQKAVQAAETAVALDESSSEAHQVLGWNLLWTEHQDVALTELERAVSLDANSCYAHAFLAAGLNFSGRAEEAIGFVKRAMRLDPNYEAWVGFYLAHSYFLLYRYEEAIIAAQEAIRRGPAYLPPHILLASIYIEVGREDEAHVQVKEILGVNPNFSVDMWRSRLPFKDAAQVNRLTTGLRKAGLE